MFSCFLVDGLRVVAKQQSCSMRFSVYVELKLFLLRRTQRFCIRRTQRFCIRRTQLFLLCRTRRFSCCVELKVFFSTLQRVYSTPSAGTSILRTYFVKSPGSGPFINAYSMKSSVIFYSALCSRTSLYPVSRVYTTLSTMDSALLCNSEIPLRILILSLCPA